MISVGIESHHVPTTKLTLYTVRKDEWDTKEATGKSIKNALYAQQYGKRHLSGWNNVKQQKIKPVASSYTCLKAVRQLVSQ